MQLDKRISMDIHPIIETRRAKRRNEAAYQHRRRRSLTRTLDYHPWASHGAPTLSQHVPWALDRKTHHQVIVRSRFVAPETAANRAWERLINPQRDLMQDVGPEVSVHVPALLPLWHILPK